MKGVVLVLFCLFLVGAASLVSIGTGRYPVPPEALRELVTTGRCSDGNVPFVLFDIRLPRLGGAMIAGGALALSGAAYQGLFRNPMVSPDILGVSSGAGFGAALAILLSLPTAAIQAVSFAGGISAVLLAVGISKSMSRGRDSILVLVLSGIVISSLFGALLSMLKFAADPLDKLPAITFWLMGSLADIRTEDLALLVPMITAGTIPTLLLAWRLNLLSFGDDEAKSMGVHTGMMRGVIIVCATLITAAVIAHSGMIGWVGLVVPHMARFMAGPDHRILFPVSFLVGAAFMVAVDTIARSVTGVEIPVGIVTAVVGTPFFILILRKSSVKPW